MNQFSKKIFLFLLPICCFFLFIELFIRFYPNTFNVKAEFIKNNSDVELLILGSSHNQNSINPDLLSIKSANLAYGGQDIQLDSALFFYYIKKLNNLKFVVLELDYHSLEHKNESTYFRFSWYYLYHNINLNNKKLLFKFLLYPSSPSFFNAYVYRILNPWDKSDEKEMNKFGFVTDFYQGDFMELNYNKIQIQKGAKKRMKNKHTFVSINNYNSNKNKMNSIINYCSKNKIKVILLSNPLYEIYLKNKITEKEIRKKQYLDSLLYNNKDITYLNYESDNRFILTDFKNDDHLNPAGAKKLTQLLSQKIDSIRNNNFSH